MAAQKGGQTKRTLAGSVYDYLDYQAFLKGHYHAKKESSRNFSCRKFLLFDGFPIAQSPEADRGRTAQPDLETGRVERGEPTITTGHEVRAIGSAALHCQMILRAAESIDSVPSAFGDLAALTVCVRPEVAAQVKERIHRFRKHITGLCDADAGGDVVYQLNLQWFPLSDPHGGPLDSKGARGGRHAATPRGGDR